MCCVSAVKYISIRTLQTKARSTSRHQGQDIIILWQGPRKACAPETHPHCPGGLRALTTQEHVQPRKAAHTGVWDRAKRSRLCLFMQGMRWERTGLWCCFWSSSSLTAPFPSAAHGPARPPCPPVPSSRCTLCCCQTPSSCLALTFSSHHHHGPANTSPWMVAVETSRGRIYFLIFISFLPYSMVIFAETKHWAQNDRAVTFSFFSPALSFPYRELHCLFWFQPAIQALSVTESQGEKNILIDIFLVFHLHFPAGHLATICHGGNN